jgi:hypothetical protein
MTSGLNVSATIDRKRIVVSAGMALDLYGRELALHRSVVILQPPERTPCWLTLTYTEHEADPMPTPTPSNSNYDSVQHSRGLRRAPRCRLSQTILCASCVARIRKRLFDCNRKAGMEAKQRQIATRRPCPRLR